MKVENLGPVVEKQLFTDKWIPWAPHTPQYKFLHCWRKQVFLIGGRGTRKTGCLVAAEAITANCIHTDGGVGYLTEQTNKDIKDILYPFFKDFINPDLYKITGSIESGNADIHWLLTGYITRLRSRQSTKINLPPPYRGPSALSIGHDEAALDRDPTDEGKDFILISLAMLRDSKPGLVKIMRHTTTPQKNFFYKYCDSLGIAQNNIEIQTSRDGKAKAFYSKTSDVDMELYETLKARYGEDFAKQELEAMWVAAKGRIWETFDDTGLRNDDKLWPMSNIHPDGWNSTKPWILGVDLGAVSSAWVILQPVNHMGLRGLNIVAEWTPDQVPAPRIINEIIKYTDGRAPTRIWIGHDYHTPGGHASTTPAEAFKHVGWGPKVHTHSGKKTFSKEVQWRSMAAAILNSVGERRLCVSKKLDTFHPNNRGVLQMMERDTWPSRGDAFFRKNKTEGTPNDEDIRDAILYAVAGEYPVPSQPVGKHVGW